MGVRPQAGDLAEGHEFQIQGQASNATREADDTNRIKCVWRTIPALPQACLLVRRQRRPCYHPASVPIIPYVIQSERNFAYLRYSSRLRAGLLLCVFVIGVPLLAQQNPTSGTASQKTDDDVLHISTDLVQTDVVVLDKHGRFADGLKPEQFELKVDGKPQQISFFESVTAGSAKEEAQLELSQPGSQSQSAPRSERRAVAATVSESLDGTLKRGRTLIFFVDDLHLSFASLERARKLLLYFLDSEMGANDLALVASPSGNIGFLQQFTDDKTVLRAAVGRLKYRPYDVRDSQNPPMSEFQAAAVTRNERDAVDYYVDAILREKNIPIMGQRAGVGREAAEMEVRDRARLILAQAESVRTNTLSSLDGLMRAAIRLPGRKIGFFLSDGFFLNDRDSDSLERLRRITTRAAQAGVVLYSIDARGLVTGTPDASEEVAPDPSGRLSRVTMGETAASQEPLFTLAADTGGRALINSNEYETGIKRALEETSRYYLLVWRPDSQTNSGGKFHHMEVTIAQRPDLIVRSRRGLFIEARKSVAKDVSEKTRSAAASNSLNEELRAVISDLLPGRDLTTSLAAKYLDVPGKGSMLTITMQIPGDALTFEQESGKITASVAVAGAVFSDQGKQVSGFREDLKVSAPSTDQNRTRNHRLTYNRQFVVKPGLYQVRVASVDAQSKRTGLAMQWIEIPDLASGRLALSSLFVGQINAEAADARHWADELEPAKPSVDQRFTNSSKLRFFTYIYNATHGAMGDKAPDVAVQIKILRYGKLVLETPLRKLSLEGLPDPSRLPYAAEIALTSMPTGPYMLQVTSLDRIAKTSASQHVNFEIQ